MFRLGAMDAVKRLLQKWSKQPEDRAEHAKYLLGTEMHNAVKSINAPFFWRKYKPETGQKSVRFLHL